MLNQFKSVFLKKDIDFLFFGFILARYLFLRFFSLEFLKRTYLVFLNAYLLLYEFQFHFVLSSMLFQFFITKFYNIPF
uniref:Uncharacterized protein n=1 Tax=uncultured marine thaumarchaeote AD1000_30_G09 TaxID=1455905 RepID=A0A075FNT8_9ARCH|nr:hypothetical protein [uncultured marine thaumarchaeote AD1000_30_G09]